MTEYHKRFVLGCQSFDLLNSYDEKVRILMKYKKQIDKDKTVYYFYKYYT